MAQAYGVQGTPAYLVFDESLKLRLRVLGDEALEETLRPLLERLTSAESTSGAFAP
jgi:hypothetical protein